jgi:hypothetical protein
LRFYNKAKGVYIGIFADAVSGMRFGTAPPYVAKLTTREAHAGFQITSIFDIRKLNFLDNDAVRSIFPIDQNIVCLDVYVLLITAKMIHVCPAYLHGQSLGCAVPQAHEVYL